MPARCALCKLLVAIPTAGLTASVTDTASGTLPVAILGTAGPPTGTDLAYFADDPDTRGCLAVSGGGGPHGAVILLHEWNGLVYRVRQIADAFAAEGYVALAADLYSGQTGARRDENVAPAKAVRADPGRMIRNLDAAAGYLKARDDVTGKVAAIGWCFGGGVALSYALGGENHAGTAVFYGSLPEDPEQISHIHHGIYGTLAGQDRGIPPEQVERFVAALRAAGIENDVHVHDDVKRGF